MTQSQDDLTEYDHLVEETAKSDPDETPVGEVDQDPDAVPASVVDENGQDVR